MKGQGGNEIFSGPRWGTPAHGREAFKATWHPPPQSGSHPKAPPHHLGWGQHQDDKANLTGILPPVLRAVQAADAHVPLQQGLGHAAEGGGHTAHSMQLPHLGLDTTQSSQF